MLAKNKTLLKATLVKTINYLHTTIFLGTNISSENV